MDNTLNVQYLRKIGKLITQASEVKVGDIVGHAEMKGGIRLYYVDEVVLKQTPPWLMPRKPTLHFKPSHVGFYIKDEQIQNYYIHTPSPGSEYQYYWIEGSIEEETKNCDKKDYDWFVEMFGSAYFNAYLIHDEKLIKLASLIKDLDIPSCSLMCQSKDESRIYDYVNKVKGDIQKMKELYDKIHAESRV